jgi:hypothetical protein
MAKILVFFIALTLTCSGTLSAQEKTRKAYRPDIPGFFLVDFGFNSGLNKPTNFAQGFWGSRTLNLYYHYPVRIGNTKFTYNPGAGFSFERFKLTNDYTLTHIPDGNGYFDLVPATGSVLPNSSIKKSMIVSNYFDFMPVEFRFDTNPKDVSRGFNFSIGGRVGFLLESHTKIKYADNGVSGIFKDKQSHGLNPIRYGAYTRIGIGNFNWFWMYNFSPYFNTGKGPENTSMNTMTIGISINGL